MNKKLALTLLAIAVSATTVVVGVQTGKGINAETTQLISTSAINSEDISSVSTDSSVLSVSEAPSPAEESVKAILGSSKNEPPENKITVQKAEEIALDKAGFAASEVYDKEAELDFEKGAWVYEVSFEKDRIDYEYVVDAVTGEILHSKSEHEDDDNVKPSGGTEKEKDNPAAETGEASPAPTENKAPKEKISVKDAEAIALNKAGFAASEVYDKETELDFEKGAWVYEVSFEKDRIDYEYVVDAVTGEILHSKSEHEDDDNVKPSGGTEKEKDNPAAETGEASPAPTENKAPEEKISVKDAEAIALNKAGFAASEVYDKETELDFEKSAWVYEVSFEKDRIDYEYVIDAVSGEILYSEAEAD